jgi:hypothetical protein
MSVPNVLYINDEARADYDAGHPAPVRLPRHITMIEDDAADQACALGLAAGGLYLKLERRSNKEGRSYGTLDSLARQCSCTTRHIRDTLKTLKEAGLVEVEPTFGPTGLQLGNWFYLPQHPNGLRAEPTPEPTSVEIPHFPSDLRAEPTPEPTPEPSRAHVMEVSNREVVSEVERETAPTKPKKRPHAIPADYWPTEEQIGKAQDKYGLDRSTVERQTERFVNHWISKGELRVDWYRSWLTWMDRVPEYAPPKPAYQTKEEKRQTALDYFMREASKSS